MSIFHLYLQLGIEHIADFKGYDHILFISTLCAVYLFKQWRQVLVLVTAFTIGHTTTLALATLHVIHFSSKWIEFLIPVTIFLTSVGNMFERNDTVKPSAHYFKYGAAMFFGLIHGLGFSFYLRSLLGMEHSIVLPLFAFNVGIELGQLIIVSVVLTLTFILVNMLKFARREWSLVLSGAGMGVSLILISQRIPW
jgi:hypothetical protein